MREPTDHWGNVVRGQRIEHVGGKDVLKKQHNIKKQKKPKIGKVQRKHKTLQAK